MRGNLSSFIYKSREYQYFPTVRFHKSPLAYKLLLVKKIFAKTQIVINEMGKVFDIQKDVGCSINQLKKNISGKT